MTTDRLHLFERVQEVDWRSRPWGEAAFWSTCLSILFVLVYGATNALASATVTSETVFWDWELRMPFVAELVVPYMSIDLFFVGSFFLFAERSRLRTHGKRLAMAILVAGACFTVFPLTTGYPRPAVAGWPAPLFELLWAFDKPHNLVPSLHVALGVILWSAYSSQTTGLVKRAIDVWFALILASPLLVWQHHAIDIVTGLALGIACLYLFDGHTTGTTLTHANRVAAKWYALGALVYVAVGIALWPWGSLLLWPAFALAVLAFSYCGAGTPVFRKSNGRLSLAAQVVLAPYRVGAWASYLVYRRNVPPFAEVAPGLYIGRRLLKYEARELKRLGVTSVLDLTSEYGECEELAELEYHNVQVLDRTPPTKQQLAECVEFIESRISRGPVYVHCALGYSRSACVAAAYLVKSGGASSVDEAYEIVRSARPQVVINEDLRAVLASHAA